MELGVSRDTLWDLWVLWEIGRGCLLQSVMCLSILRTVFVKMLKTLATPSVLALTLFLYALRAYRKRVRVVRRKSVRTIGLLEDVLKIQKSSESVTESNHQRYSVELPDVCLTDVCLTDVCLTNVCLTDIGLTDRV